MAEVTLSAQNRIVLPREVREALHVKPGDKLMVVVRGSSVILQQEPPSHHQAIRGIGCGLWTNDYLSSERRSWD